MFWNGSAAMEGLWAKIEGQAELIALQTRSFTNKWAHPAIKLKITASPLCVPKTKSERIDDEVRAGWRANL
jgi:hypothetical protein